ncbi:PAS domain S-box protein [Alginatibacterium sediminis]|uniref:PAS domain S-box protein n=1 Tax=Alginatibacterium sediminis TaxID=2164068 RepID=A0A420E8S5_9ALTE|nr:methyl-accepting chemotaxis protein [Alginatibacterium sediminis]RKF15743.1 PAS domain S-box protein [Alginatibacterium sediminis]
MRNNQPITSKQQRFRNKEDLVSITDPQGKIKFINKAFEDISGYSKEELIGQDHNIVRHPEMPAAAFEDLWSTIRSGLPWRGMVKNRCKNGDYYWVEAFVSPIVKKGKIVAYQSVRSEPSEQQEKAASELYAKMRSQPELKIPQSPWYERLSIKIVNRIFNIAIAVPLFFLLLSETTTTVKLAVSLALILQVIYWLYSHKQVFNKIELIRKYNLDLASGDFTQSIDIKGNREVFQALASTKMVQARFKAMFMQVGDSVKSMITTADQLSSTSYDVLHSMKTQNSHTTQIATGMNEMSVTVEGVRENVHLTAETTKFLKQTVEESDQVIASALEMMESFTQEMKATNDNINDLARESLQISSITTTISSIAEQTNLLALNAAIEAARAGEQGRGFAVVADEVRSLAARTQDATSEIQTMLEKLSTGISQSATTIEENNESANQVLEKVSLSREQFVEINKGVENINQMSIEIATASSQQSVVATEMATSIETISNHASSTEVEGENLQKSSIDINQSALDLQKQINELELSEATLLDFETAKQAHIAWKTRTRSYLNGDTSAITKQQACSHRDCALGQWYYGDGQKLFGDNSTFKSIEKPHAQLHKTVVDILQSVEDADEDRAESLYKSLEPLSQQIVQSLDKLEREVTR